LAALLSRPTESVAAKTGDMIGGLLNATLSNLTELVIRSPRCVLGDATRKASITGAIVSNALFMLKRSGFRRPLSVSSSWLWSATVTALSAARKDGLDSSVAGKRVANCAVRRSVLVQLPCRPCAHGSAILKRRCRNDADCNHDRVFGDQYRSLGLAHRGSPREPLPDFRDGPLPIAASIW